MLATFPGNATAELETANCADPQASAPPGHQPVNWPGLGITVAAFVALQKFKADVVAVIAGAAVLGVLRWAIGWG